MKLLVCASEYYPYGSGIANVAYNVVEKLKEKGVECTVCSPTGPDIKLGSSKLIQKYGIFGLIHYWNEVSNYFNKVHNNFDVVWLHNPILLKNNPFDKCLVTMHSTYYGNAMDKSNSWNIQLYKIIASIIEKYSLTHLNSNVRFTGVGTNVCKELESIGINEEKITFIPNGVDTRTFKPYNVNKSLREKFGIPENNLVLLSVGRLTAVKRPIKLIKAFEEIKQEMGNVTLVFAGKGELLESIKNYIEKRNLKDIIILGYVDYKRELPELYSCSDYFIMASKYEGGEPPLTLSEAMASGLPCIVSNIPNFNIVKDSNCGIMVDFSDVKENKEKIINYLRIDNSNHSKNARMYIENHLDWEVIADKYIKELTYLVKNGEPIN